MKMTPLKYIIESGAAQNSTEIISLKRSDPKGFDSLLKMAEDEMTHNGIEIERLAPRQQAA